MSGGAVFGWGVLGAAIWEVIALALVLYINAESSQNFVGRVPLLLGSATAMSAISGLFTWLILEGKVSSRVPAVVVGAMFPAVFSELVNRTAISGRGRAQRVAASVRPPEVEQGAIPLRQAGPMPVVDPVQPTDSGPKQPRWLQPDVTAAAIIIGAATGVLLVILAIISQLSH